MSNSASDNAPKPRLCHVKKWSDFNGYGFNLHAEKGKAGQFIGKVDAGSPAESAGLKEGDRIIEVNGTNIGNENHSQVVQRIKTVPNATKLLVVDDATDAYFKEKKIVVRGDMSYVETIECADEKGGETIRSTAGGDGDKPESAALAASPDGPSPRQCHMVIWPDFQGYGFNLHAEKGKPGQFIGKVDPGSPAEAAGLKQGDRIVEVNSQYIGDDNHAQVVQKIKSDATRTTMLVVDEEAENYYRQKGVQVSSTMAQTRNIHCPASKADYQNGAPANGTAAPVEAEETKAEVNHNQVNGAASSEEEVKQEETPQIDVNENEAAKPEEPELDELQDYEVVERREPEPKSEPEPKPKDPEPEPTPVKEPEKAEPVQAEYEKPVSAAAAVYEDPDNKASERLYEEPEPAPVPASPSSPVVVGGIEFAGSAKEARAKLSKRSSRKHEVKKQDGVSMRDKYELFQKL